MLKCYPNFPIEEDATPTNCLPARKVFSLVLGRFICKVFYLPRCRGRLSHMWNRGFSILIISDLVKLLTVEICFNKNMVNKYIFH